MKNILTREEFVSRHTPALGVLNEETVTLKDSIFGTVSGGLFNFGKYLTGKAGEQIRKSALRGLAGQWAKAYDTAIRKSMEGAEYEEETEETSDADTGTEESPDGAASGNTPEDGPGTENAPAAAKDGELADLLNLAMDTTFEVTKLLSSVKYGKIGDALSSERDKVIAANKGRHNAAEAMEAFMTKYTQAKGGEMKNVDVKALMDLLNSEHKFQKKFDAYQFVNKTRNHMDSINAVFDRLGLDDVGEGLHVFEASATAALDLSRLPQDAEFRKKVMTNLNFNELRRIELEAELSYTKYVDGRSEINQKLKTYWEKSKAEVDSTFDAVIDGVEVKEKLGRTRVQLDTAKSDLVAISKMEQDFGAREFMDSLANIDTNSILVMQIRNPLSKDPAYAIVRSLKKEPVKIDNENFYWFTLHGIKTYRDKGKTMTDSQIFGKGIASMLNKKDGAIIMAVSARNNSARPVGCYFFNKDGQMLFDKPMDFKDVKPFVDAASDEMKSETAHADKLAVLAATEVNSERVGSYHRTVIILKKASADPGMVFKKLGFNPLDARLQSGALDRAIDNHKNLYNVTK